MTVKRDGLTSEVVQVTPEIAAKWMEQNSHNREIVQRTVDTYARDMKAGRWRLTHQGIAFNCNDVLIDGQHRLWAVIDSGSTVPMVVTHGMPVETQLVIDGHRIREAKDYLSLTDRWGKVGPIYPATLKRMLAGVRGAWPTMSHEEMAALFGKYKPAIDFAVGAFPAKRHRVTCAAVYAVIARAYYSKYDKERIRRFCFVMSEASIENDSERAALALRDMLISGQPITHRAWGVTSTYMRTQNALYNFLNGKSLSIAKESEKEFFPLSDNEMEALAKQTLAQTGAAGLILRHLAKAKRGVSVAAMSKYTGKTNHEITAALGVLKRGGHVTEVIVNKKAIYRKAT